MRIIALVIGNNNYPDPDKLENAVNDAKSMEDVFCFLCDFICAHGMQKCLCGS